MQVVTIEDDLYGSKKKVISLCSKKKNPGFQPAEKNPGFLAEEKKNGLTQNSPPPPPPENQIVHPYLFGMKIGLCL